MLCFIWRHRIKDDKIKKFNVKNKKNAFNLLKWLKV